MKPELAVFALILAVVFLRRYRPSGTAGRK